MGFPHIDFESISKANALLLELEGIVLNILVFFEIVERHLPRFLK
jgi:hypothetical protein